MEDRKWRLGICSETRENPEMTEPRKLLVLIGSPRRAGNSAALAKAVQRRAEATGAQAVLRFVDDFISSFLRDCRSSILAAEQPGRDIFEPKYSDYWLDTQRSGRVCRLNVSNQSETPDAQSLD
jgi:hypothetical protein